MDKQKLVEAVAKQTGQAKSAVAETLEAVMEVIQEQVAKGEDVTLMGFGTFLLGHRKGGKGYNPHTGKEIEVEALRLPKFRAGKAFKEKLNR